MLQDVLSQLIMCLKYIHSHGLSAKVIHPTKVITCLFEDRYGQIESRQILVTDTAFLYPPRVYLNCVGLLDALAQESVSAHLQRWLCLMLSIDTATY